MTRFLPGGHKLAGRQTSPPGPAKQPALREEHASEVAWNQISTCLLLFTDCLAGSVPNDIVCLPISPEHLICSHKTLFIRMPVDENSSIKRVQMEHLAASVLATGRHVRAPFRAEDLYPATSRLGAMLQGTMVRQRARRRPGRVQEEPGGHGTVGASSSAQSLCP